MSVRLGNYLGRFGNRLTQYVIARLTAEKNGLHCDTDWIDEKLLPLKSKPKPGINAAQPVINLEEGGWGLLQTPLPPAQYVLHGYFQQAALFNPHRDQIREYFDLPEGSGDPNALVMHVRLTDYWGEGWVISPDWYHAIIRQHPEKKLFIVTDDPESSYFESFPRDRVSEMTTPMLDFHFLRQARNLICSNSTFCWWAAFLGRAEKIYTFQPWLGNQLSNLAPLTGATVVPGSFLPRK